MKMINNIFFWFTMSLAINSRVCATSPPPTHKDVEYSTQYGRSRLDVWLPEDTNTMRPMVVFFHGGGFKGGDKSQFRNHRILSECLRNGIAGASVNYPLLKDAGYLEIMSHAGEAIKFLKAQSTQWHIASDKIAVMGGSAGAMIAEYLTYWLNLGITACFAQQQPHHSWFLLAGVKKGDPPLILYTGAGPDDEVHHPDNARRFKKHFDLLGARCEIYGAKISGLPLLPDGTTIEKKVIEFFLEQWTQRRVSTDVEASSEKSQHHHKPASSGPSVRGGLGDGEREE